MKLPTAENCGVSIRMRFILLRPAVAGRRRMKKVKRYGLTVAASWNTWFRVATPRTSPP